MHGIRPKVIRSGLWSVGGSWLSRGLGILKVIILARLLSPFDFGIIGLTILSINLLNVFFETGIESALIQKDNISRVELDTAWTIAIIRASLLFFLLFFGAGWFANYFDNSTLKPVLKVMSMTLLLEGFTNIGIVYFQKELEFKKKIVLDSLADIAGATIAILIAFFIRNVWALVAGSIVWVMVKCLGSYKLHPYRPRISLDWRVTKSLLNFGKHIFWISLVTFIVTSGDDALVGKLLGVSMLGFYTMAYNIANVPVSSLTGIIGKITFPAYSLLASEPDRLREAFMEVFEAIIIILLPLTGIIILLAQDFTQVCLGDKWLPIIPALRILCLLGFFRGLSNVFAPVQLAVNRPHIQSRNKTIELLAFIVLIYPLTAKWGLIGASLGVTLVYSISALINTIETARILRPIALRMARTLVFPLTILVILIFIVLMTTNFVPDGIAHWRLLIVIFLTFIIYGGALLFFRKHLLLNILPRAAEKNR